MGTGTEDLIAEGNSGVLRATNGRNDHEHEMLINFQVERCSDKIA